MSTQRRYLRWSFYVQGLLVFSCCLVAAALSVHSFARASAFLSPYQVEISDSRPSAQVVFRFRFQPNATIASNSRLRFSFDASIPVPSGVGPSDGALTVGGVAQTLAASSSAGKYGYRENGGYIWLDVAPDQSIATGTLVELLIGKSG